MNKPCLMLEAMAKFRGWLLCASLLSETRVSLSTTHSLGWSWSRCTTVSTAPTNHFKVARKKNFVVPRVASFSSMRLISLMKITLKTGTVRWILRVSPLLSTWLSRACSWWRMESVVLASIGCLKNLEGRRQLLLRHSFACFSKSFAF